MFRSLQKILYFPGEMSKIFINKFFAKAERIRKDFESYCKENEIGKKQILENFGLLELDNYILGIFFFNVLKVQFQKKGAVNYFKFKIY